MNILLLGHTGQVGWELQRALAPLGAVVTGGRHATSMVKLNLLSPSSLALELNRLKPDLIVNAAAYTAVDKAETEPEQARLLNTQLPGLLADRASALGIPLVHYSTDYVFDGSGSQARSETDPTGPLNVYGQTKLAGEDLIRASGSAHLILRTSWVYARTMLRLANERDTLQVIDDQIGAPTGADLLADVTAHACRKLLLENSISGTYHCAAQGETSWFGYANFVLNWARAHGHKLRAGPGSVVAVRSDAYASAAKRPLNSLLETQHLRRTFGIQLPAWELGVERTLAEILG
jgi:dTDP-4-dehydrorhamnose reductase